LGVSAGRVGDTAGAVANYESAIKRLAPLAEADPQASYFLAGALGNLAGVYEYRGETDRARAAHERALPVHRQAHTTDPKNGGAFQDLVWTTFSVARLQRDPKVALAQLTAAGPLIEQYASEYPKDYSRADVLCSYHRELSEVLLRTGDNTGALKSAEESVRHITELTSFPPQFQQPWVQASAWAALAEAHWATGDAKAAEADWIQAAELIEAQPWSGIVSGMHKGKLAAIYDRLAEAATRRSDPVEATNRKKQASEVRDRLWREHPEFAVGER
jgi:tetratricopeptide (TPR) repeat protein